MDSIRGLSRRLQVNDNCHPRILVPLKLLGEQMLEKANVRNGETKMSFEAENIDEIRDMAEKVTLPPIRH